MSKSEIDAEKCKTTQSEAVAKLKQRYLRMYRDTVKAMHDAGKYMLAKDCLCYKIPYETWMAEDDNEQQISSTKKFSIELAATSPILNVPEPIKDDLSAVESVADAPPLTEGMLKNVASCSSRLLHF